MIGRFADYLCNCTLFVQLHIICAIAHYLHNCSLLDLVLFLPKNLQDMRIICTSADNLRNWRLFVQRHIY